MSRFIHSFGIIAGLGSLPVPGHALDVVEWSEPAAEAAAGAGFIEVIEIASQHGGGTAAERLATSWSDVARAVPARTNSSPVLTFVPAPSGRGLSGAGEEERGSPLLAGLGAVALLMWRRLRRH